MADKLKLTITYHEGDKRSATFKGDPVALNDDLQDWLRGTLIGFGFSAVTVAQFFNEQTDSTDEKTP